MSNSSTQLLRHCQPPYALHASEAQRIFHGRGGAFHGLEHVVIDWLPPVMLLTLYAPEASAVVDDWARALQLSQPSCEAVVVQYRDQREGPMKVLIGSLPSDLLVQENGLNYAMTLGANRNTGLFLDMRNGRQWVREQAEGKRVLNLFAYTCGFSVAAVAGGASQVLNVDTSSPALSVGRRNHMANQQDLGGVKFEKLDIFRSFGRLAKRGPFDLLVCDPPTLQKGSVNIGRDYPKIIRRLDQLMADDADLLMCFNAPHLDGNVLLKAMSEGAPSFKLESRIPLPEAYVEPGRGALKVFHYRRRA